MCDGVGLRQEALYLLRSIRGSWDAYHFDLRCEGMWDWTVEVVEAILG